MEIQLKTLSPKDVVDFVQLIQIFEDVFELDDLEIPPNSHLENLLSQSNFLVLVATTKGKVVGGLTVHLLSSYYSLKPTAYIYDVGIKPAYQRKGIGKRLITYLTQYCKNNGFKEAYVEAETDDQQAVNFYRKTQASSEMEATHFTYWIN